MIYKLFEPKPACGPTPITDHRSQNSLDVEREVASSLSDFFIKRKVIINMQGSHWATALRTMWTRILRCVRCIHAMPHGMTWRAVFPVLPCPLALSIASFFSKVSNTVLLVRLSHSPACVHHDFQARARAASGLQPQPFVHHGNVVQPGQEAVSATAFPPLAFCELNLPLLLAYVFSRAHGTYPLPLCSGCQR